LPILDAATRCFARRGYFKTAVADICREAGVSKREFRRHFQSKGDVENALLDIGRTKYMAMMRALLAMEPEPGTTPVERILTVALTWLEARPFDENRSTMEWWIVAGRDEVVLVHLRETWELWKKMLEALVEESIAIIRPDIRARDVANGLLAVFNGLLLHYTLDREAVDCEAMAKLMRAALRGALEEAARLLPALPQYLQ
jgi:AcrR family transcriptional regulator